MPRLLALLAVGAACAVSLDLENEQRHDVFDDALDDAAALLAPDHAAAKESTARGEAALAREDPYLAVEPTREVERLEPEVTDDALGPLVAKVARGPPSKEEDFEALARDVAEFASLRTSTSEDVVDFVRWGGQGAREADDDIDEVVATEAGAEVAEQAPELYAPRTRRGPADDNDAPDDDLGGLVKGLGGGQAARAAVDDAPPAAPLRVPDREYNAWDDEVERAAQVGYVGPRCTDCVCRSWDGENYGECRPTTDADPCDTIRSYCVKCEADGETPMPGLWTTHARQCERYEGLRDDDAPPARARAAEGEGVQVGFEMWSEPPYALPDSYPRWFKVLYRQPWILWYLFWTFGGFGANGDMPSGWPLYPPTYMVALPWVVIFVVGFAVGRATAGRKPAAEAPAAASLAALARENHGDLAEKGMSPFVTPRGRGATVRLAAMPMPSPASVAEQDY